MAYPLLGVDPERPWRTSCWPSSTRVWPQGFSECTPSRGLKDLLEIPEEYTPIGIVTVGHGAVDRKSASLGRGHRKRHHVVHWNRWDPEWSPDF